MSKAIGMIETHGLVYAIEAADAMMKASNVELVSHNLVDGGIVTMTVQGDVGAVQAAVDTGKETVLRMNGKLLSAHVIPRATDAVYEMIKPKELQEKKTKTKPPKATEIKKKNEDKK